VHAVLEGVLHSAHLCTAYYSSLGILVLLPICCGAFFAGFPASAVCHELMKVITPFLYKKVVFFLMWIQPLEEGWLSLFPLPE